MAPGQKKERPSTSGPFNSLAGLVSELPRTMTLHALKLAVSPILVAVAVLAIVT